MTSVSPRRVFISYSHDSEAHAERVLELANRLRRDGVDAWIDQYETAPAQGWPLWMEDQVEWADFVLCVCTETYAHRFDQKEDPGRGLGVAWEGGLIRTGLYFDQGQNEKFLPILFAPDDAKHIPEPLAPFSHFQPLTSKGYDGLYRHLTNQPKTKAPALGKLRSLPSQPRRSLLGTSIPASSETASEGPLASYEAWTREHYAYLDLIGIDAGDVRVKLDEIYVPLRVASRPNSEVEGFGLFRGRGVSEENQQPIEIEEVLHTTEPRHVLIFGEPGSGKTTALHKLHQLCWQSAPDLGLDEGMVPILLRLRHLDPARLDQGLAAFIEHEVYQLSGGRLSGLGEALWKHRNLLLLFDGLDEIADAEHRSRVLRRIGWYLGHEDAANMRAVVSCRRVGLPSREADRDHQFQTYEVRPFQNEQIEQLVKLWFRELARYGKIDQATADRRVNTILCGLFDRKKSNQQILEMASNPLLLTLLCVVVLLGNEIPKKRVRFYEQCLDVLLDRWPQLRGEKAPVELATAREALAHLAFYLHAAKRRDDLGWVEAVAKLVDVLGDGSAAQEFFEWAHSCVGLLVDYTDEEFGFVHLGLQEHLSARHLIAHPADLQILSEAFDESWWTEVFLQISALSERAGFSALMSRLLEHTDALERRAGLLGDCLRETSSPDLVAFVRVLEEGDVTRQMAVLQLLSGFNFRPAEWLAALEKLRQGENPTLAATAARLLGNEAQDRGSTDVALMIDGSKDAELAEQLAHKLRGWHGGRSVDVLIGLGRKTGRRLVKYGTVLVLVDSQGGNWKAAAELRKIYPKKRWLLATLPNEQLSTVPDTFSDCEVLYWRLGEEDALIASIVECLQDTLMDREVDSPKSDRFENPLIYDTEQDEGTESEQPLLSKEKNRSRRTRKGATLDVTKHAQDSIVDPVTGAVFLRVPGGKFEMGSNDLYSEKEKEFWRKNDLEWVITAPVPACQVRLSPFWLARTPVTNEQYEPFLLATHREEPSTWRDRRFSDPQQPVVNVSWEDATAYCNWLTENHPRGYIFQLPSEAQWEYAARGPRSRTFPWGEEEPSNRLACFGLDHQNDKPANVGSFPGGAGPFGHFDLAGLVWEWCRDAWEPDLSRWSEGEPLDPLGMSDPEKRPLRGGGWAGGAVNLRSALRFWFRPWIRYDYIGFRVLLSPPSLGS